MTVSVSCSGWFEDVSLRSEFAVKMMVKNPTTLKPFARCDIMYRVVQKKLHKVLCTTILQPYVKTSCGFQQNVQKEIVNTTVARI